MTSAPRLAVVFIFCLVALPSEAACQDEPELPNQAKISKQLKAGKKAIERGDHDKAIQAFSKAEELSGYNSATASLGLGNALWGKYQSLPGLRRKPASKGMSTQERAEALYWKAQWESTWESTLERAESAYRKALDLSDGELSIAWYNLSSVLEAQGNHSEAKVTPQEYLARASDNTSVKERLEWEAEKSEAIAAGKLFKVNASENVLPPQKMDSPAPPYTEEARQKRLQGVVILEAIIDAKGNVRDLAVLEGLPMGLTESAVATVRQWKYQPATHNGEPVAVLFSVTIRFSVQ